VTLTTPRGTLKARLPAHLRAKAGDRVSLSFKPERLSLFDATTGKAIRSALHEAAATRRKHG
jgi:multiple sugar transport system ATP-binding protein